MKKLEQHASDCAVNNEPAMPTAACDCGFENAADQYRTKPRDIAVESSGALLTRLGTDGHKWAAEFRKTAIDLGYDVMDEGWLVGWFANAIEAGRTAGQRMRPSDPVGDGDQG